MLPSLSFSRDDGNTGSARAAPIGIIAIIAACSIGVAAKPTSASTKGQAIAGFGFGDLTTLGAHILGVSNKPVVLCKVAASVDGTYGAITRTGAPVSTPSAITAGVTKPLEKFRVLVEFLNDGVVGTAGIKYRESLDNGDTFGAPKALGTANSIAVVDARGQATGVTLALGAGNIAAGEKVSCTTTGPLATLADIQPCLDALAATGLSYEAILVGSVEANAATINGIRTALNAAMASGLSKRAFVNVRPYAPATETAQNYIDALAIISDAARIGTRVDVCADGARLASPIRGIVQWQPTSLFLAARVAKISLGTDAAYVADGPLDGAVIVDDDGNAICWDEASTPGLDDLGFVTIRTFARRAGAFIGNPRVFSPVTSDFVFDQQERCMCAAEERAWDFLTDELSSKKRKDPVRGPNGEVYLLAADIAEMQEKGTLELRGLLKGEVDDVRLKLSRVDDVGANSGARLTASIEISSLVYIKGFDVTSRFVRSFNI